MLLGENERLTCFCFAWPEGAGGEGCGGGAEGVTHFQRYSSKALLHASTCVHMCVCKPMCVFHHESVLPTVPCLYCVCTPKTYGDSELCNICESQHTHPPPHTNTHTHTHTHTNGRRAPCPEMETVAGERLVLITHGSKFQWDWGAAEKHA